MSTPGEIQVTAAKQATHIRGVTVGESNVILSFKAEKRLQWR
jgi:hypothetical protein